MQMNFLDSPIFITGMARSGTSMTAGVVSICGAWGGNFRGPNKYNKKGMFENKEIVEQVIKPILRMHGFDPMGQKPLPPTETVMKLSEKLGKSIRNQVRNIIKMQGFNNSGPWFYKGAKICLLWPAWQAAFPNAKYIIVRRDVEDVVASCLKTGFMRAYKNRSGWLYWTSQHERKFEEMVSAGLDCYEIWPQRMISGDFLEIENLINKLGLKWKEKEVFDFIDPKLWARWRGGDPWQE